MTRSLSSLFIVLTLYFLLTGCTSREDADATLAKGCEAAVGAMLPADAEIDHVTGTSFTPAAQGTDFRHVTLNAVILDGWLEVENEYECTFQEKRSLFGGHRASFEQLKIDDRIYGRSGNEIVGSMDDFTKIEDAVRRAMYE